MEEYRRVKQGLDRIQFPPYQFNKFYFITDLLIFLRNKTSGEVVPTKKKTPHRYSENFRS